MRDGNQATGYEPKVASRLPNYSAHSDADTLTQEQYSALIEVTRVIASHKELPELLNELAVRLRDLMTFNYLAVTLHDADRNVMCLYMVSATVSPTVQKGTEFPINDSIAGWVWKNQTPMLIGDLESETRFPKVLQLLRNHGVRSVCAVPLTTGNRELGVMGFGAPSKDAYIHSDLRLVQLIAAQVAVAVENALNFGSLQDFQTKLARERDRLRFLLNLTNSFVSKLKLEDLFRAVSKSLRPAMHCDAAFLSLPEENRRELRVYGIDFPDRNGLVYEGMLLPVDGSSPGRAFRTGEPVLWGSPPRWLKPAMQQLVEAERIQSACFIPLICSEQVLGVLHLLSRRGDAFNEDDVGFLTHVANQIAIAVDNALQYRNVEQSREELKKQKAYLENEIRADNNFADIVGGSATLRQVLKQVETVAPTDSTVLLLGETGTGKELIARAIHDLSGRHSHTFVKVNCAAIPTGLLESELFGHEKGAFTGAIERKVGRFELANKGTLFLDEVGDISLELQPKLLRVLQEQEFERLGSTQTQRVDVRIVAATNIDLQQYVTDRRFRSDLYYRLNIFPIGVPALRDRAEDIPELVRHFVHRFAERMSKEIDEIPAAAMEVMAQYSWPGNIRELQNLVERAVILSPGKELRVPLAELKGGARPNLVAIKADPGPDTLESAEREHILRALHETNWVIGGPKGAATRLGLKRTTLVYKMQKLGIFREAA